MESVNFDLLTMDEVVYLIKLGDNVVCDANSMLSERPGFLTDYYSNVVKNWNRYMLNLRARKRHIRTTTCSGCKTDQPNQQAHFGGCMPDVGAGETWEDMDVY